MNHPAPKASEPSRRIASIWRLSLLPLVVAFACACAQPLTSNLPSAPKKLTLNRPDQSKVSLTWEHDATGTSSVIVERRQSAAEAWSNLARLDPGTLTWNDTTVSANGDYTYRVSAKNTQGTASSPTSNITITDIITTLPGQVPSNWNQTGWHVVFEDEFSAATLDSTKWTVETGRGPNNDGWGNNELQYYQASNISLGSDSGTTALTITARQESVGGASYTSARIKTQNKYSVRYGRIEARMKLTKGNGIWPAFWMLGSSISTVGWPACGEIDIMEVVGGTGTGLSDSTTWGTLHWSNTSNQWTHDSSGTALSAGTFADAWHLFGVEWNASTIIWYLDGQEFARKTITASEMSEFQGSFFLLLNLAVGGNWPGAPTGSTVFPQRMMLDWVRVWQAD